MVSSGAFWVAISYRLTACFTGIGSTCGVEIYWRSILGTIYNYSLRKTVGKKMTKMGQNLIKIAQKIALFLYIFRICSLKILTRWKSRGARAPVPHSWRRQWTSLVLLGWSNFSVSSVVGRWQQRSVIGCVRLRRFGQLDDAHSNRKSELMFMRRVTASV